MTTIKLFLAVNQDGDFVVSDQDTDDAIGDLQQSYNCEAVRTVELTVTVEPPKIIALEIPAEAPASVTAAAAA